MIQHAEKVADMMTATRGYRGIAIQNLIYNTIFCEEVKYCSLRPQSYTGLGNSPHGVEQTVNHTDHKIESAVSCSRNEFRIC